MNASSSTNAIISGMVSQSSLSIPDRIFIIINIVPNMNDTVKLFVINSGKLTIVISPQYIH